MYSYRTQAFRQGSLMKLSMQSGLCPMIGSSLGTGYTDWKQPGDWQVVIGSSLGTGTW